MAQTASCAQPGNALETAQSRRGCAGSRRWASAKDRPSGASSRRRSFRRLEEVGKGRRRRGIVHHQPRLVILGVERVVHRQHLAPEDIVGPMLFLASLTSGAMTGQALVIDGGVVVTG